MLKKAKKFSFKGRYVVISIYFSKITICSNKKTCGYAKNSYDAQQIL